MGSLFDGIGAFPLAAVRSGIRPVWASEIEKAPVSITKRHFPDMKQLGDITKLDGGTIPPVHVITFGSPCQNLSMIGKREGLAGRKSGLFYQAVRIIQEMREATDGLYPVITVWENVPGAFSSNDRMDFRAVLESLAGSPVPMPPSGQWASAGMVRGHKALLGWRLMDARYWGSPALVQRRKRVFLVADFGGERTGEILFKPRRMLQAPAPCGKSRDTPAKGDRSSPLKTGREIPIVHPFRERRLRSTAKEQNPEAFLAAFGRPDDPFPTLLARSVDLFSVWLPGKETEGRIRRLTPLECERLMGLPEGWTRYGADGEPISDYARYHALGNAIALPCADYIMAGIREALEEKR